ncbi:DUF4247 domain-containing protein [Jiangella rhizosphaerae]|uniref:DUF4247 domain-containing protein n=1 Tax=Jiangella rhizosphaerae TaxID=2293569 RepID=A0A418KM78_9ACTN|nr:DUF4247 domain-containing protein [Jiangella rhizosphaerae]RIQ19492.1 DUF4247 domain-containing protein [Jiangella rhizosphaerae]
MTARRAVLGAAVAAALLLSACGSDDQDVRDTIAENYELVSQSGDYAAYRSDDDVLSVAGTIESAAEAGRDHSEGDDRYLGYEETMVHIAPSPGGGSDIEVTDVRDGYDRWGPVIVPVWGLFGGGYRSGFSGGGSGFGK